MSEVKKEKEEVQKVEQKGHRRQKRMLKLLEEDQ